MSGRAYHIALIAPPWHPTPPVGYGPIQLVVAMLSAELRARGHHVTVFGARGSLAGTVEMAPDDWGPLFGTPMAPVLEDTYLARVLDAIRSISSIDIVHDHSGFTGALACSWLVGIPVVHTVQVPMWEPHRMFYRSLSNRVGLVAVSDDQRRSAPEIPWLTTAHNAADLASLRIGTRTEKDTFLLCLARICPSKGQHVAIEIARKSRRPLVIAGEADKDSESQVYFERLVEPHIDGSQVVYFQNVAGDQKARLLATAHALLAPISWPEPCGLSVIEAMASGTPAISFRHGAASEVIADGRTGFLVNDVDGMVRAVSDSGHIDPLACATYARRRFSPSMMATRYLRAYRKVLGIDPPRTTGSSWNFGGDPGLTIRQ